MAADPPANPEPAELSIPQTRIKGKHEFLLRALLEIHRLILNFAFLNSFCVNVA
jgi:hypothetical protein